MPQKKESKVCPDVEITDGRGPQVLSSFTSGDGVSGVLERVGTGLDSGVMKISPSSSPSSVGVGSGGSGVLDLGGVGIGVMVMSPSSSGSPGVVGSTGSGVLD